MTLFKCDRPTTIWIKYLIFQRQEKLAQKRTTILTLPIETLCMVSELLILLK